MTRTPAPLRLFTIALLLMASPAAADTRLRIMPPEGAVFAVDQRFDIRVEATAPDGAAPPRGLRVRLDEEDLTGRNVLDPGVGGERGAGGTGSRAGGVDRAPAHTTNFLVRGLAFDRPGTYTIRATTRDGAEARATVSAVEWRMARPAGRPVRNIILLLGDGMGAAHRTAARVVSRGVTRGKANGLLAMDTMEVTGQVMTFSLNSVITDSAPGMSAYVTGHKSNNNQVGVYPDNTLDPFDNPRVEYLGAMLRRHRGPGFGVGLVTTSDVTDATPAGNAVHTADRGAGPGIAARYFDEREANGLRVLLGGGARHFLPAGVPGSSRADDRALAAEFRAAGFHHLTTGTQVRDLLTRGEPPPALLGLFHPGHLPVAFDKVGAGRYSDELATVAGPRDLPMLDELTRLALDTLATRSPDGFYLMVEGASIDKQAHAADAERTIWDTIEFDNAVAVALDFARRTNTDEDPDNDTLVIVAADHETGGMAIVAVGNERYRPARLGAGVRDYAAVYRFEAEQLLDFEPNYEPGAGGYPAHPDPSRKLLIGWAAAPDRYENWISNRLARSPAVVEETADGIRVAVANPARSGPDPAGDNRSVEGEPRPGFLITGAIENGASGCPDPACPGDTASSPHTQAGHTATDVPLSASGPGAFQFTGTYDNTEVFLKLLRAATGSYEVGVHPTGRRETDGATGRDDEGR